MFIRLCLYAYFIRSEFYFREGYLAHTELYWSKIVPLWYRMDIELYHPHSSWLCSRICLFSCIAYLWDKTITLNCLISNNKILCIRDYQQMPFCLKVETNPGAGINLFRKQSQSCPRELAMQWFPRSRGHIHGCVIQQPNLDGRTGELGLHCLLAFPCVLTNHMGSSHDLGKPRWSNLPGGGVPYLYFFCCWLLKLKRIA